MYRVDEEPEEVEGKDEDPENIEDIDIESDGDIDLGEGKITQEYYSSSLNALSLTLKQTRKRND